MGIKISDGYIQSKNGNLKPKITTKGWKIVVEMNDGSEKWVPLKNLKELNTLQVAEYAITNNLFNEPAFK